jgi:serine/threonine protein kinase
VGEQNGISFLVMQYFEGETLQDRLAKGALPLEQALKTAIEIASALDKAHRAGIVHRDLKPGNIMLTKAGAKLLDFGPAKSTSSVRAGRVCRCCRHRRTSPRREPFLARFSTWRPNSSKARRPMRREIAVLASVLALVVGAGAAWLLKPAPVAA